MALKLTLALVPLLLAAQPPLQPNLDLTDWAVKIGPEAQLFADDYLVARQSGIRYTLHPAEKSGRNPLIVPSEWEKVTLAYGSVLRDRTSSKLRMWYTDDTGIAYAESADGLAWKKPPVGLELNGRVTNVLTKGHRGRSDTLTVFENPDRSHPTRRFLAYPFEYRYPDKEGIREQRREGIYLRTSPDGIHWTERPEPVMYSIWRAKEDRPEGTTSALSDVNNINWDPKLKRFMGYIKIGIDGVRTRGLVESEDGIHWSRPHLILRADEKDRPGDQIYSMVAFPYESMWLGYIGLFHKETDDRMDIQLVTSRDGRNWYRPIRTPFLTNGGAGAFDEGVIHMMANAPLQIGGKLHIYFGGYGPTHSTKIKDKPHNGIGLATLRPQGFVSADAPGAGSLETRPLDFSGKTLHLNAAIRPGGEIRVTLLDAKYNPIPGYISKPLTGDSTDLTVQWQSGRDISVAEARLRFEMKDASLYAFWIR